MTEKEFIAKYGVRFTTHSGKMEGIRSLSTSCDCNRFCKKRQGISGTVCEKCYTLRHMYKRTLRLQLEKNFDVLTHTEIPVYDFPEINALYFRIESFGDVANEIHALNYINLCRKNPDVRFVAWTKNINIWSMAFRQVPKPVNLRLIQSSVFINKVEKKHPIADKVFTVWSDVETCQQNRHFINCGRKRCIECKLCYRDYDHSLNDSPVYIDELLK